MVCPVPTCKASLNGLSRDTLQSNWLADQFISPKPQQKPKMCQLCAENGTEKEAIFWCQTCATRTPDLELYCDACEASEHSSRITKSHIRIPVERQQYLCSVSICQKHQRPEDLFCFDEGKIICQRCEQEGHGKCKTKLVSDHEQAVKAKWKASSSKFKDMVPFLQEEDNLKKSRAQKEAELKAYQNKVVKARRELAEMDQKIKEIIENSEKSKLAAGIWKRSIENYPLNDVLDKTKVQMMQTRLEKTQEILSKHLRQTSFTKPVLKPRYKFGSKFARDDEVHLVEPYGISIDCTRNVFVVDSGTHQVHVFSHDGFFLRSIGDHGSKPGFFQNPQALVHDLEGNLPEPVLPCSPSSSCSYSWLQREPRCS